jgi:hypothetical protein
MAPHLGSPLGLLHVNPAITGSVGYGRRHFYGRQWVKGRYPRMPPDRQRLNNFIFFYRLMLRPIAAAASLVLIAGISFACSKGPLAGDTTFSEAKKGFEKEMTPAQRKAAIKDLQTQTNWQAQ